MTAHAYTNGASVHIKREQMSLRLEKKPQVRVIRDYDEAVAFNDELMEQPLVASDTEWYNYNRDLTPINNGLAACLQFCWREASGELKLVYLHNHGRSARNIYAIKPWISSPEHHTVLHNAPVDAHIVQNHGILPKKWNQDTMVLDFLVDENRENRHGLKECAEDHFGRPRRSYNETFGASKLRKDGQPYASGQLIVPSMNDMLADVDAGNDELFDKLVDYSTNDAWDTWSMREWAEPKLRAKPWVQGKTIWDYWLTYVCHMTDVLQRMERKGMPIDLEFMKLMTERCNKDLSEYESIALEWAGCAMNLGSKQQLAHLLYGNGPKDIKKTKTAKKVLFTIHGKGFPLDERRRTPTGDPSTKAEHLVELRRVLDKQGYTDEELYGFDAILKYNKYEKQRNTYLTGLLAKQRRSRIHGRANQIGTTSGRLSFSDPNLQNITTGEKDIYNIRDCFVTLPGYVLIVADFSQLEYRLLAHFSQEPKLIKMFLQKWDLHSLTTYNIFPNIKAEANERFGGLNAEALAWIAEEYPDERKRAKTLNFEIIYGVGHKKLADQLRISEDEGKRMINGWFSGYPYVKAWMARVLQEARQNGFGRTLWGRYRHPIMRRLNSEQYWERGEEERTFTNALIQGSAADMTMKAMLNIDNDRNFHATGAYLINQVHDELIYLCPRATARKAVEIMRPHMEQPFNKPLRVPMPVAIGMGTSWASAKV